LKGLDFSRAIHMRSYFPASATEGILSSER
jgi:hypothetical protein